MGDILKEAIADAKAVRETALQNAKMALEEAFTPQLKSMLSAKLKEDELEEGEPVEPVVEEDEEEDVEDVEDVPEDEPEDEVEEGVYEDEEEMGDEEDVAVDDEGDDEEFEEESLELEDIIRELESELSEDLEESEEPVDEDAEIDENAITEDDEEESEESEDDEDEEELEEVDKSSEIGNGDNNRGSTDTSSGIGKGSSSTDQVKMESVAAELAEYKEAVSFLKDKLHEVNILNAKLLFTNKLFKEFSLNNNQKLKVVETFDRAQTSREIKLVYSTLCEQFGDNDSITKKKSINESASASVGSTKPSEESKKVITEESQVANRFRKLAGLIK
jgi:hypothetical protein